LPLIRTAIQNISAREPNVLSQVKSDACLTSLAAKVQGTFLSQTLRHSRHAGSWIFANPKYVSWHEPEESSLLLITANPGFGKTTLAAHISQRILADETNLGESADKSGVNPVLLYHFFRRSNQEVEGTASAALRTVITQLVQQLPSLFDTILRHYHFLSMKVSLEWSCEKLQDVVDDILGQMGVGSKVYIILDAIDECDDSKQMILDWVQGLMDHGDLWKLPKNSRPTLKVLVTSRPDENVCDRLSNFPTLEMTKFDTAKDMCKLIHSRTKDLSYRRHLNPEVTHSISRFLEDNAHGMFLWVVLVLDDLSRRDERLSDEAISSKLSRIPLTLVHTYEGILQNVAPSRRGDMWRIIRWLLYGRRGLTLAELESALCSETSIMPWHDFEGDLKLLCGSLIRFDGTRGEINLLHQTTRDFLKRFAGKATLRETEDIEMTSITANRQLAEVCVQYLLRDGTFEDLFHVVEINDIGTASDYQRKIEDFLSRHPLLCYAIESWAFHLRAIGIPSSSLSDMVRQLLASQLRRDGIMRLTYFIVYQGNPYPPMGSSPIHLASYFNLPWLVELYISEDPKSVHTVCVSEDTPLIWAAEMGSVSCAKILLDAGTDPNAVEWDGWSALHRAARNGHLEITKLLLHHKAKLEQQDGKALMPLDWAAGSGHCDVFEALEEMKKGSRSWRPLCETSVQ
jgi:hypothetical protein